MVLQQSTTVNVWGFADVGESVIVTGSWDGSTATAQADNDGNWKVTLQTPAASSAATPYTLTVEGNNTIVYSNVVMGEVWVLSGQSNMQLPLDGWPAYSPSPAAPVEGGPEAIAAADYPNIRIMIVGDQSSATPQTEIANHWSGSNWKECSPSVVGDFSALGYFFGRDLHQALDVPVGLVQDCWGGSSCETWAPPESLNRVKEYYEQGPWVPTDSSDNQTPSVLWNGMISPILPYTMKGVLWYQGETNMGRMEQLSQLFPEMIRGWRQQWGQGDFPFCFALLAPYDYYEDQLPRFWEAQASALALPNTGMAVTLDVGDLENIHPAKKEEVGQRMALWARSQVYGEDIEYSGPLYKSMAIEGDSIRVYFDHVGSGLKAIGGTLEDFAIAGSDGVYQAATATIDGETVVVNSPSVSEPRYVSYAFTELATGSLANNADIPAAPFRSNPSTYNKSHLGNFYRPDSVLSGGIYALNDAFHDSSNAPLIPYGVTMEIELSLPEAFAGAKRQLQQVTSLTDANSVRLTGILGPDYDPVDVAEFLQDWLMLCHQSDLLPVVGFEFPESAAAGSEAALWTTAEMLAVVNRFESQVVIYLAGPGESSSGTWQADSIASINTLRTNNGGTLCLLMLEAPDSGQDAEALITLTASVVASDSAKNLAWGIRLMDQWQSVVEVEDVIDHLAAERLPVVVSGFSPESGSVSNIPVQEIMQRCVEAGMGYLASTWISVGQDISNNLVVNTEVPFMSDPWGATVAYGSYSLEAFAKPLIAFDASLSYHDWSALVDWDGAEQAVGSDPDGDQLSNELEFLYGMNPVQADGHYGTGIYQLDTQGHWQIRLSNDARGSFDLTLQVSDNLADWTEATLSYNESSGVWELAAAVNYPQFTGSRIENGIWYLELIVPGNERKFMKLNVSH